MKLAALGKSASSPTVEASPPIAFVTRPPTYSAPLTKRASLTHAMLPMLVQLMLLVSFFHL